MSKVKEKDVKVDKNEPQRKFVSIDDLYRLSTQFLVWSFTTDSLQSTREQCNKQGEEIAKNKLQDALNTYKAEKPEIYANHKNELSVEKLASLVSLEEEAKYLTFYAKNIIPAVNFFKLPTQVKASAISFFKRFYLVKSVMEYHPKKIMYTCVFLAAKSENYFISIESFSKALPKISAQEILDLEFVVLQSLKFTLLVHHPFRPLYGFFLDFQAILLRPSPVLQGITVDSIGHLYDSAKKWLNDNALLSDVCFLFTPPQLALGAMYCVDRKLTEAYLKKKFLDPVKQEKENQENEIDRDSEDKPKNDQYEQLIKRIRKCIKLAKDVPETTREESVAIDKKCFYALHPKELINRKVKKLTQESSTPTPG